MTGEPSTPQSGSGAGAALSFTLYADRRGPAEPLAARRQRFTANAISRALAADGRRGTVGLGSRGERLHVGSEAGDYERIRIVERTLGLIGTMSCNARGEVTWRAVAAHVLLPEVA